LTYWSIFWRIASSIRISVAASDSEPFNKGKDGAMMFPKKAHISYQILNDREVGERFNQNYSRAQGGNLSLAGEANLSSDAEGTRSAHCTTAGETKG